MYTYFFSHYARSFNCIFSLLKGAFIDVQDAPAYVKVVPQFGRNNPLLSHGALEDERSVSCLDVSSYLPTCTTEPPLSSHSGASRGWSQWDLPWVVTVGPPLGSHSGASLGWPQWASLGRSQWGLPWAVTVSSPLGGHSGPPFSIHNGA